MNEKEYLDNIPLFVLRNAIERLRVGLFDPLAVRMLTAHEQKLELVVNTGFKQLSKGVSPHLCVCGSYGQGKSHSLLYIKEKALNNNLVTSTVNLDLRELPLHDFRHIYIALIKSIQIPNSADSLYTYWEKWIKEHVSADANFQTEINKLLPKEIPHLFRSILVAIAEKNMPLSAKQKKTKRHSAFLPKEIPYTLERALIGEPLPISRLRNALKYRQVSFYKEGSLSVKDIAIFMQMIKGLAKLFQQMGFKGWVILFDEGEAITQVRVSARSQSYQILDQLFAFQEPSCGLYPIIAFTNDFYSCLAEEDYEREKIVNGQEIPYFAKNYHQLWQNLNTYQLQDLTEKEWDELTGKLLNLYCKAYEWQTTENDILEKMRQLARKFSLEETRYILKALIEQLDILSF